MKRKMLSFFCFLFLTMRVVGLEMSSMISVKSVVLCLSFYFSSMFAVCNRTSVNEKRNLQISLTRVPRVSSYINGMQQTRASPR